MACARCRSVEEHNAALSATIRELRQRLRSTPTDAQIRYIVRENKRLEKENHDLAVMNKVLLRRNEILRNKERGRP